MKPSMSNAFVRLAIILATIIAGCSKNELVETTTPSTTTTSKITGPKAAVPLSSYTKYTILKGLHDCTPKPFAFVNLTEMKYSVYFDSSAVYQTLAPSNQADINKLFGFSDNNASHQTYSARIGWRWYGGKLELLGYVYNAGVWSYAPITTVSIGAFHTCSIKVVGSTYVFTVNAAPPVTMPRKATTKTGAGYRLFPYFGGDEVAPQNIYIWMYKL